MKNKDEFLQGNQVSEVQIAQIDTSSFDFFKPLSITYTPIDKLNITIHAAHKKRKKIAAHVQHVEKEIL